MAAHARAPHVPAHRLTSRHAWMLRSTNKRCVCSPYWTGEDCSTALCPHDCSGHGTCVDGACECDAGWSDFACASKLCQGDCSGLYLCTSAEACRGASGRAASPDAEREWRPSGRRSQSRSGYPLTWMRHAGVVPCRPRRVHQQHRAVRMPVRMGGRGVRAASDVRAGVSSRQLRQPAAPRGKRLVFLRPGYTPARIAADDTSSDEPARASRPAR